MQKIIRYIFPFFFTIAVFARLAFGQSAAEKLLAHADSLYERGKYREAAAYYRELMEQHGSCSPQMLAKAAFIAESTDNYDEALYYLNLLYTRMPHAALYNKITDLAARYQLSGYDSSDEEIIVDALRRYIHFWGSALLVVAAAVTAYLLHRFVRKKAITVTALVWAAVASGTVYVLQTFFMAQKTIIRSEKAFIMSAPAAGAELLMIAKRGDCFRLTEKRDIWCRVVQGEKNGYVRCNNLWIIE